MIALLLLSLITVEACLQSCAPWHRAAGARKHRAAGRGSCWRNLTATLLAACDRGARHSHQPSRSRRRLRCGKAPRQHPRQTLLSSGLQKLGRNRGLLGPRLASADSGSHRCAHTAARGREPTALAFATIRDLLGQLRHNRLKPFRCHALWAPRRDLARGYAKTARAVPAVCTAVPALALYASDNHSSASWVSAAAYAHGGILPRTSPHAVTNCAEPQPSPAVPLGQSPKSGDFRAPSRTPSLLLLL